MNLMVDPILTPTEYKKDANKAQGTTRKREETRLEDVRISCDSWIEP